MKKKKQKNEGALVLPYPIYLTSYTHTLLIAFFFLKALTGSEGGSYLLPWRPKPWEAYYEAKKSHFTRSIYGLLNHLYYVAASNSII